MTDSLLNLQSVDLFEDAQFAEFEGAEGGTGRIHIRIQQRNGRKTVTSVEGLPSTSDFKGMVKHLKKNFCCNGTIVVDPKLGTVLQMSGDQRQNMARYIVDSGIATAERIKLHGF
eukprot:gnl/Hemi2/1707_TR604_c0_g1_i1.p2 gnl/Hemi2/1707_TR604_c0_g1~~gnl/Hemi2/1707_TR604_c0_g1_i1.p2  ORF type:complete len:115 (+),score=7.33 gnl/Hemi2/1707_TR604_c0_g1_i1:62-406(+)